MIAGHPPARQQARHQVSLLSCALARDGRCASVILVGHVFPVEPRGFERLTSWLHSVGGWSAGDVCARRWLIAGEGGHGVGGVAASVLYGHDPDLAILRDRRQDLACADLGISRRTFYEWRAKGTAPRCISLPNGTLRVRRSEYHRWLAAREGAA